MDTAPLAGIRVIDLSQYLPGPYATRILCDLGAEVIKIEPPAGDPLRKMFSANGDLDSPVYGLLNRGKSIARLDLKDPGIMDAFRAVVAEADVFLESFRPGVVARLGLGHDHCSSLNPGLIYCSLSGYGQDGPLRLAGGHDINYCAAAGVFSFSAMHAPPFPLMADHGGAMSAVNAILAALLGRTRHGRGAVLDISLYETMLSYQYPATAGSGEGNAELLTVTGGAACYNFYRTADQGVITLGALEPVFWRNFCEAMAQPDWTDRQFEAMPQEALIDEVRGAISSMTLEEVVAQLEGVDCCFEPVPDAAEIHAHRQTVSRCMFTPDRVGYPGRIDGHQPFTDRPTRDLPVGVLPRWTN